MSRVYLGVPFERKEEAKALGARWDPGVRLWWIGEGVATPFPIIEHDYKTRRDKCRGQCFEQVSEFYYKGGCGACDLQRCPDCKCLLPLQLAECNEGRCMNCAVAHFSGKKSHGAELYARKLGNAPCCIRCGEKLVPIGSDRLNGGDTDDWDSRMYHKKCFAEMQQADKRFFEEEQQRNNGDCPICNTQLGSGGKITTQGITYHVECHRKSKEEQNDA